MIATAKNSTAGMLFVAGAFLFFLAIGINTIYSIQHVCLDVLPPQCNSAYDSLGVAEKALVSPGLYLIAALVVIVGVVFRFRRNSMLEANH